MVSISPGVLEGRDGLSGKGGAVMNLYPAHPTRAITHPHKLEHPLARLRILAEDFQQVGPTQHEQRARFEGSHRSITCFASEQRRLPEEGAGTECGQIAFVALGASPEHLHTTAP